LNVMKGSGSRSCSFTTWGSRRGKCLLGLVAFLYTVPFHQWRWYQHLLGGWFYIPVILSATYLHPANAVSYPGRPQAWSYIDARSLAWYRRGLAVLLLLDQLEFSRRDWLAFFTNINGLSPWPSEWTCLVSFGDFTNGSLVRDEGECHIWTLHAWSDSEWWQDGLRAVAIASASLLYLEFFPQVQCATSALLLISRNNRNLIVQTGADQALVKMLIWGALLPLNGGEDRSCLAALIHLTAVYIFSGLLKMRNAAWTSGDALRYILLGTWREWTRPMGAWLAGLHPEILRAATLEAEILQIVIIPVLVWLPYAEWRPFSRTFAVGLIFIFHGSLELMLRLKLTSWAFIVWWLLAIPSAAWDACCVPVIRRSGKGMSGPGARTYVPFIALSLSAYFVFYNWAISTPSRRMLLPSLMQRLTWYCGLDEYWDLFVDDAVPNHGWFYSTAELCDGTSVDAMALFGAGLGGKYRSPPKFPHHFEDPRWCRVFDAFSRSTSGYAPLAAYMCRKMALAHKIEIGYTEENPFVGNTTVSTIFWTEICGACNRTDPIDLQMPPTSTASLNGYTVAYTCILFLATCMIMLSLYCFLSKRSAMIQWLQSLDESRDSPREA